MSHTEAAVAKIISRAKSLHLARIYQLMREPDFNRRRHRRQTIELFKQFDAYAEQIKAVRTEIDFAELEALLDTAAAADRTENHLSPVLARIEALVVVPTDTATRGGGDTDPFGTAEEEEQEEEAETETSSRAELGTLPPLVREMVVKLQTQSADVTNRFEALLKSGANLSRKEFSARFDPLSLVTSLYHDALRKSTVTLTDAEFAEYKQLRDFTTAAAADTFFEDMVNLHDFIADRIGTDHVVIHE